MFNIFLLSETAQTQAQPGFLDAIFGGLLNIIFNIVYSISPVYSLGITIIAFTILVKLLLYPLAKKQYITTKQMQIIQPELKEIQNRYKDKKDAESQQKMYQEIQDVHKKHGTSMFGGCLPALIQLPIILALFSVLRNASTYITKLTEVDGLENFFGINLTAIPTNPLPSLSPLQLNIDLSILIPILTALTTYITIKYTSSANTNKDKASIEDDPAAQMEKSMSMMTVMIPWMIFFSAFGFPSGLGLYWLLGNIISILQQFYFIKYINVTTKAGANK